MSTQAGILANPHVIANYGITFERYIRCSGRLHLPALQRVKRECRYSVHLVI